MKASELIKVLESRIKEHGDGEVAYPCGPPFEGRAFIDGVQVNETMPLVFILGDADFWDQF